jgi:hypothetical protein
MVRTAIPVEQPMPTLHILEDFDSTKENGWKFSLFFVDWKMVGNGIKCDWPLCLEFRGSYRFQHSDCVLKRLRRQVGIVLIAALK